MSPGPPPVNFDHDRHRSRPSTIATAAHSYEPHEIRKGVPPSFQELIFEGGGGLARGFAAAKADFEGFLEGSRQFFHLIYGRDNFVDEINFARVALIKQRGEIFV